MRLAKSIDLVLGLVASGGIMLVLSGSAYAADSGLGTVTQGSQDVSQAAGQVVKDMVNKDEAADSQAVGQVSDPTKTDDPQSVAQSSQSSIVTTSSSSNQTGSSDSVVTSSVVNGTVTAAADPTKKAVVAKVKQSTVSLADVNVKTDIPAGAAQQSVNAKNEDEAASGSVSDAASSTVAVGSLLLEIQPKITTSRPLPIQDLAASVPTAADQGHSTPSVPQPAKSTGLFSRLAAELASTVVPLGVTAPASGDLLASTTALLLAVLFTAVIFLGLNFGASLRRSGFVHAARSDVADTFSSFATPVSLSYELAIRQIRSSFLMVSENQKLMSATL